AADAAITALDLVERLEAQLTVYRDTSAIVAINRRAFREPVAVEPRLFDLLARAVELSQATGGAFDITSGPLSKIWGFYRRQGSMPAAAEVAAALALVGSDKLTLNHAKRTIRFQQPGMELNLGAIGKGHALDRAAEVLTTAGIRDFCVHGGNSSVLARGFRISDFRFQISEEQSESSFSQSEIQNLKSEIDAGWSIALRHPLKPEVRLAEFRLVDQALGTSGSGTQFFHYRGKRYGHILDPRTGWPADKVLSATVIAPTAEQADALSTALYVMGLEAAREFLAARPEIAALLVTSGAKAGMTELHPINLADDAWRAL
ncbi:MAG: FAD:protein FMN transferase, partial [Planctomycetaceae bacterium]|nr:FAD:protein FMN transferase [Planctomycetaceae bacterium]